MRWDVILLGLVVLRTMAQNGFCPMCTKECHTVMNRPNFFWGQFWGQNGKADSDSQRSNKCAALVSLRNADTNIMRFSHRKSSMNQYINFTLYTEVVRKHYSTPSPCTTPVTARNASVWAHSQSVGIDARRPYTAPNSMPLGLFSQERLFLRRLCPDGFHLYRKSLH